MAPFGSTAGREPGYGDAALHSRPWLSAGAAPELSHQPALGSHQPALGSHQAMLTRDWSTSADVETTLVFA